MVIQTYLFRKQIKIKQNEKNQNKKHKIKLKIFTSGWIRNNQAKYLLRAYPFTGKVSSYPSKLCRQKEIGPNFSEVTNGPSHRFWNLVCSPFPSQDLSHLRTKSPTLKFLWEAELVLNHLFTICWCWSIFWFACVLTTSNFNKAFIQFSKGGQSSSWIFCDNCK